MYSKEGVNCIQLLTWGSMVDLCEDSNTVLGCVGGDDSLDILSKYHVVVCFLLGNSPASEFYMPTFRNTLSVPSS
jgi:hypothetical protein